MHQTPLYISNLPEVLPPFALRTPSQKTHTQNFLPPNLHVVVKTVLDQAGLFRFFLCVCVFLEGHCAVLILCTSEKQRR